MEASMKSENRLTDSASQLERPSGRAEMPGCGTKLAVDVYAATLASRVVLTAAALADEVWMNAQVHEKPQLFLKASQKRSPVDPCKQV